MSESPPEPTDNAAAEQSPDNLTNTRRAFLKGAGVAAGTAALGTPAAAQTSTETATETSTDDGDWLANGWAYANQNVATVASKAMQMSDVAKMAALGPTNYTVAQYLYGKFEEEVAERTADQMHLDHYAYVQQINESLTDMVRENYNSIQLDTHHAVASAKWAMVEAMQEDAGTTTAELDARGAVFRSGAVFEKNLLQAISAAFVKLHSVRELQTVQSGISDPHIKYYMDTGTDQPEDPTDTVDIDIELMDGTTHTAKALLITSNYDDSLQGHYVHPYFYSNIPAENPASASSDYDTLWQLQYQWDNNGGHRTAFQYDEYDSNNPAIQPFAVIENIDSISDDLAGENQTIANYVDNVLRARYETLADEMQTLAADAYEAYSNGQLQPEDLIDPYMVAQQNAGSWRETGHFTYAGFIASQQGFSSDLSKSMRISYYDDSETTTQTMTGIIAASPDVISSTSTDSISLASWSFDSSLDITGITEEYLTRRTDHTVTHTDDSGSTTTLVEGDDYSVSWQDGKESIRINSDGTNIGPYTAGNGSIDVQVTANITTSMTWEVGQTYTVASDGDYVFAKTQESGGGMITMDAGDEFTVEKIWNASGDEISSFTSRTYNIQTKTIAGLIDQLRNIEQAQQDLEDGDPPDGGGGGGSDEDGSGDLLPGLTWWQGGGIMALLLGSLAALGYTKNDSSGGRRRR